MVPTLMILTWRSILAIYPICTNTVVAHLVNPYHWINHMEFAHWLLDSWSNSTISLLGAPHANEVFESGGFSHQNFNDQSYLWHCRLYLVGYSVHLPGQMSWYHACGPYKVPDLHFPRYQNYGLKFQVGLGFGSSWIKNWCDWGCIISSEMFPIQPKHGLIYEFI